MRIKAIFAAAVSVLLSACTQAQQSQSNLSVKVVTWEASHVTNTSALLSGRYVEATSEVRDHGFYWGTSESAMNGQLGLDSSTEQTANFEATLSSLEPGTTYYFKAYVTVWDSAAGKFVDVEGRVQTFTTSGGDTPGPGPEPEPDPNPDPDPDPDPDQPQTTTGLPYLSCYEMPAITGLKDTSKPSGSGSDSSGPWWNYETTNSKQMIISHAFRDGGRMKRNWTALFDGDKQAPLWSAFAMHDDEYPDRGVGRGSWHKDPAVPDSWQSCFASGNYHRGHLVASNYRQGSKSTDNYQVFYYTNQALQEQNGFNGSIWNALETAVKKAAPSGRDTLYVVVGLLYETQRIMDGKAAPSHFYKLLMKCGFNADGSMKSAKGVAYLMENDVHDSSNYDSAQYRTTIDAIEERTGFDFYANIPKNLQDAAEKTSQPIW